jgi:hypothetical protein
MAQMVALETVALEDLDRRDRGEWSVRIALRSARFLESEPAARRSLYQRARLLYEVRSELVPSGEPLEDDGKTPIPLRPSRVELDALMRRAPTTAHHRPSRAGSDPRTASASAARSAALTSEIAVRAWPFMVQDSR